MSPGLNNFSAPLQSNIICESIFSGTLKEILVEIYDFISLEIKSDVGRLLERIT